MKLRFILVAQFVGIAAILLLGEFLNKFIGAEGDLVLDFIALPLLCVSAVLGAVGALWRPKRARSIAFAATLGVAGLAVFDVLPVRQAGDWVFFITRRAQLESFAREIRTYGRVSQMDDGTRYYVELNGDLVTTAPGRVTTESDSLRRPILPLETVLQRNNIDRGHYERFRHELIDLKFIAFVAKPGYTAFLYDGFLDNLNGFIYVEPGMKPPALHSEIFESELVELRPISDRWFYFATT